MNGLICSQCGGTINIETQRCEYCGTAYNIKAQHDIFVPVLRIENPRAHVLQTKTLISQEMMQIDAAAVGRLVMEDMARQIAESIMPMVEITKKEMPERMHTEISGRVRVLDKDFRF